MAARTRRLALIILMVILMAGVILIQVRQPPPSIEASFPYGEIRIGTDASNPPFAVATADDLFGLEIDLGRALGDYFELPVRFVNLSYDGLYDALKTDQVDILIAMLVIEPQRSADVLYTRHYFNAGLVLVSSTDQPIQGMSQLADHRLAYEFGSNADSLARRWLRRIAPFTTLPYERPDYALDALRFNQADAALVDAVSARLYLRDHNWQAQINYVTDNWYPIAVPADEPGRWQLVDKALRDMASDGTLDAIINRWL
jgi:arginine/lysine/histidine/glutamine transport system substrate-binding/permease protein